MSTEAPPAVTYPFETLPDRGRLVAVAAGVYWIRMALPYALDHINLWALEDDDGWTVVDTGVYTEATIAAWLDLLAHWPDARPITRVIVTHMHPDHVGMAGWLTRKFSCRLWMTRLEYLNCRVVVSDTGREAPQDGLAFLRRAGWSEVALEYYRARFGLFGKHVYTPPDSYRRLVDGEEFSIGGRLWRVVVGNGHSPEHACLYCPALGVFIAGDQILPRISSNVSTHPMEPDANPMSDWYRSLAKVGQEVPDEVLVLPSHNECFRGLHARIKALKLSQDRAFERLRDALQRPHRAVDVFASLFSRAVLESDGSRFGLATGEAVACLNYLVSRGEVCADIDASGTAWYRMIRQPSATGTLA